MRRQLLTAILFSAFWLAWSDPHVLAQKTKTDWVDLPLNDLGAFKSPDANWSLASSVSADRNKTHDLVPVAGTGVLVNRNNDKAKGHLLTNFEHGDIDLELEVMVPKGSNSGIYLQGKYEIQIFDSWLTASPAHSDMGGIYQRWNDNAPLKPYDMRGYEGKAPRVNASKAPGLWQKLSISFRAPRFDAAGKKIENARFIRVVLNGAVIHQEAEVSGPTRGAYSTTEAPFGPILIQGDHGPVAFRNIRYKLFNKPVPTWSKLDYEVWYGSFKKLDDFVNSKPAKTGSVSKLTWAVSDLPDKFALRYKGVLLSAEAAQFIANLGYEHKARVILNGKIISDTNETQRWWKRKSYTIELNKGDNIFEMILFKDAEKNKPSIQLTLESDGYRSVDLHNTNSLPEQTPHENYYLEPGKRPQLQRVFAKNGNKILPYSLAAGDPSGIHYLYNLNSGAIFKTWKGAFANMQGLWDSRGSDQIMWPLGAPVELDHQPIVAILPSADAVWPDTLTESSFKHLRYRLDSKGYPIFEHEIQGLTIADIIRPESNYSGLKRELKVIAGTATTLTYARIAAGKRIVTLADGSYRIEGPELYIIPTWDKNVKATVRNTTDGQELLVPISNTTSVTYSLNW